MKALAALFLAALPMLAQSVKWEHTLAAGQQRARKEKKPIFLDVYAEWCPPCQFLKSEIFPSAEAQAALAKYVPVSLMVEKGATRQTRQPIPEAKKEAEPYQVRAFPTLLILDADGKVLRSQVGSFRTPSDFAAWLNAK